MRLKKTSASVSESSIRASAAICPAFLSGLLNAEQAYNNIKTGNIRHFFIIFINLSAAADNNSGIFFHILYFSPKCGIMQGNDEILNFAEMLKQVQHDVKRFYLNCSLHIANCSLETQNNRQNNCIFLLLYRQIRCINCLNYRQKRCIFLCFLL